MLKVKKLKREVMGIFLRESRSRSVVIIRGMAEEEIALNKHQEILKSSFIITLTIITII